MAPRLFSFRAKASNCRGSGRGTYPKGSILCCSDLVFFHARMIARVYDDGRPISIEPIQSEEQSDFGLSEDPNFVRERSPDTHFFTIPPQFKTIFDSE